MLTDAPGKFLDHIKSLPQTTAETNPREHITKKCTALYEIVLSMIEMKML